MEVRVIVAETSVVRFQGRLRITSIHQDHRLCDSIRLAQEGVVCLTYSPGNDLFLAKDQGQFATVN